MFSIIVVSALATVIVSSLIFFFGWGLPAIRAYRHGSLRVRKLVLLDFVGFNVAAFLLGALAMYGVITVGIQPPSTAVGTIVRAGQTVLIAALCTLRCIVWIVERKHDSGVSDLIVTRKEAS